MAFTTATVASITQSKQQLQGAFNEMWLCNLTVDPASIAAAAEDSATFTIPGVAVGDMILGWSAGVSLTADADVEVFVSAANTITIRISNLNASTGLDLASSTWKVFIGRPNW